MESHRKPCWPVDLNLQQFHLMYWANSLDVFNDSRNGPRTLQQAQPADKEKGELGYVQGLAERVRGKAWGHGVGAIPLVRETVDRLNAALSRTESRRSESTSESANSLTRTARRRSPRWSRRWRRRVVLPLPRKPVTSVQPMRPPPRPARRLNTRSSNAKLIWFPSISLRSYRTACQSPPLYPTTIEILEMIRGCLVRCIGAVWFAAFRVPLPPLLGHLCPSAATAGHHRRPPPTTTSGHRRPPPPATAGHHRPPPPAITSTTAGHHLRPPPTTTSGHHRRPPPPATTSDHHRRPPPPVTTAGHQLRPPSTTTSGHLRPPPATTSTTAGHHLHFTLQSLYFKPNKKNNITLNSLDSSKQNKEYRAPRPKKIQDSRVNRIEFSCNIHKCNLCFLESSAVRDDLDRPGRFISIMPKLIIRLWQPKCHFSWRKLEERALGLRGETVELEREKILGEGVWRGFHMVAPASSHRSTSKSRFVLRELLKKKTALVSKDQVLCLLQEEEKGVKVLCLTGLMERFVKASLPCCGSKRRVTTVLVQYLEGRLRGVDDQILCLLQEEEKGVKVLYLTGLVERFVKASPPCCGSKRGVTTVLVQYLEGRLRGVDVGQASSLGLNIPNELSPPPPATAGHRLSPPAAAGHNRPPPLTTVGHRRPPPATTGHHLRPPLATAGHHLRHRRPPPSLYIAITVLQTKQKKNFGVSYESRTPLSLSVSVLDLCTKLGC
ncbi:hypothetical protein M5K25_021178 [Dendrobium thyrsiflorum]|uniref:Uncharacterized protein n=1 Tax=Dendrobium thyrsiflorum TaxID=117978 RepID=A0ABD0UIS3_DENTH